MALLPAGTRRRAVVEWIDRHLGSLFFQEHRTLSALCGERLDTHCLCRGMCQILDLIEKDHCLKNKGKP